MAKKVLLFLAQGFEALEAAVFTDVMGWSREEGLEAVELETTALHNEIKCTWNLIVRPEIAFSKINPAEYDALAIPGGFEEAGFYEDAYDEAFQNLIRRFHDDGKIIASVCVGAMPVGKSGILNSCDATTYDLSGGHRRKQLEEMGAIVLDQSIVTDNNIITSTGPATAMDVAFLLLEKLTSKQNVESVKKAMRIV